MDKRLHTRSKIFGIGLSRTGTKSLTVALQRLGFDVVHYPTDETTFNELTNGKYNLSLLNDIDGITDITAAPFYAQLDELYPDSKFILTVRDEESWLRSLERHWEHRSAFDNLFNGQANETIKMEMIRFLRAAVYGAYSFSRERMSYVYNLHYENVTRYFKDRPQSLLILNIAAGEGWAKLCPFLKMPVLDEHFPHSTKLPSPALDKEMGA